MRIKLWLDAITGLFARNWITLLGASVTTVSALFIIGYFAVGIVVELPPYAGIVGYMVLPGAFVTGLLIIPVGAWWDRRRRLKAQREGLPEPLPYPRLDLNDSRTRRAFAVVGFLTIANLFILSTVTYRGVVYSDSVEFCGLICHTVMEPQYTAFLDSPHARVRCAECHIGPGAPWFVRSKLDGARQVFAVALDTYPTPVPSPVENLRPARDTCEQCHWPSKFTGDRIRVIEKFSPDEDNTPLTTVLSMHIGGGNADHPGIHSWHINPNKTTEYYATDYEREDIVYVRVTNDDGEVTEYFARGHEDLDPAVLPPDALREMDCIDCHNRPTHVFRLPGEAMDRAMALNRIDADVPYIKARGVETLEAAAEVEDGRAYIAEELRAFYQENYPELYAEETERVEAAIAEVQNIYGHNVFPRMNVTWGTYPNHIGHTTAEGCFRCHTNTHRTLDEPREAIRQDCTICHSVLAWDEHEPAILQQLGL